VSARQRIVLATTNRGKLREIAHLLEGVRADFATMDEAGFAGEIEEHGATFEENALIKARAVHSALGGIVIADDSGLAVDALGGRPGVRSARYGGEGSDDGGRIDRLLAELADVPEGDRTARFVTVAAAVWDGGEATATGTCEGVIGFERRGAGGFGYDPVFLFPDTGKTMAELDVRTKNGVSARGRAFRELLEKLRDSGPKGLF
jgi:XTP/dITP diphosphohydrolase